MISAVLDTNTLASGTLTAITLPGQIIDAWRNGQFELIISNHILNELERTLKKTYFQTRLRPEYIEAFFNLLQNEAIITPITVHVKNIATHPEDDLTLATALSAKANYLVTGDGPLLRKVGPIYKEVKFVTPKIFLQVLMGIF